jgi:hypothetical protein
MLCAGVSGTARVLVLCGAAPARRRIRGRSGPVCCETDSREHCALRARCSVVGAQWSCRPRRSPKAPPHRRAFPARPGWWRSCFVVSSRPHSAWAVAFLWTESGHETRYRPPARSPRSLRLPPPHPVARTRAAAPRRAAAICFARTAARGPPYGVSSGLASVRGSPVRARGRRFLATLPEYPVSTMPSTLARTP